ncbi:unnamed protein product [Lathyrus sativus]|nr:unnamed protein product [Lathyrus sativus]
MICSLGVSERGSRSQKHHDVTIQGFQKIIEELDLLDLKDSNEDLGNSTSEVISKASSNEIFVCDPPVATTKGRPRTFRMKGSLELCNKSAFVCSYCKNKVHNKRKCSSLNQIRCDIINGQFSNVDGKDSTADFIQRYYLCSFI